MPSSETDHGHGDKGPRNKGMKMFAVGKRR